MRTIIEMVNLTRLDCAIASAGQSRIALSQALNHIRNRSVFQRRLADQPAMRAVVADLALELEAQVALVFRLVPRLPSAPHDDPREAAYARLLTPAREIPGLQEHAAARLRIARVPGRQRLHRGPAAGALLPRGRRSTPSGKARATSWRSTCCAPPAAIPTQAMATRGRLSRRTAAAGLRRAARWPRRSASVLKSGDAERRARFLCEGRCQASRALAALAEAKSDFATLYGDTRLKGAQPSAQFGTADLGGRRDAGTDGTRPGGMMATRMLLVRSTGRCAAAPVALVLLIAAAAARSRSAGVGTGWRALFAVGTAHLCDHARQSQASRPSSALDRPLLALVGRQQRRVLDA